MQCDTRYVRELVLAFDDSGGIERLCRWNGDPIPGDHPIVLLAAFYLDRRAEADFNREWRHLRGSIRDDLGCDWDPPIHLRLMWGKTLKRRYRGKLNPYVDAEFKQIQAWVAAGWEIVERYVSSRMAGWFYRWAERTKLAEPNTVYLRDPRFQRELATIRLHSQKLFDGYHRLITSPLLHLYVLSLASANELTRASGRSSKTDVLVDPFGDSHGIDAAETVEAMKQIANLQHIGTVDRVEDADELPVVQAADLVGYCTFRLKMMELGHIRRDEPLSRIVGQRRGQTICGANVEHIVRRRYGDLRPVLMTSMHYALARSHVERRAPEFAADNLVPVDEFQRRAESARMAGDVGISILTDSALQALEMPKAPD